MNNPLSRFDLAVHELRPLGISLTRLPGEYRVNYHNGSKATERFADDLDGALACGHALAKEAPAPIISGKRRKRPVSEKAARRRKILAHNHRVRARAIKKQRKST